MAVKNHALDNPITAAAQQEFLSHGYEKASLRKIAAQAQVTIGAIYTRYPTKDALFGSLVQPLLDQIDVAFTDLKADYYQTHGDPAALTAVMEREADVILHLLFDHYDRAVLLLCRSAGSSWAHCFDAILDRKIQETAAFFQTAGAQFTAPDPRVLKLLLSAQFHLYSQIISEGYDLAAARQMLRATMVYHTGGWMALFGVSQASEPQEV